MPYVLYCLTCLVPYVHRGLICFVDHLLSCLMCLVPQVLCIFRALVLNVSRVLRALVHEVLSCLLFLPCALRITYVSLKVSTLIFSCLTWLLFTYLLLVTFFGKFTTVKIKLVCRQYFGVTVNINKQYNLFNLYSEKYFSN